MSDRPLKKRRLSPERAGISQGFPSKSRNGKVMKHSDDVGNGTSIGDDAQVYSFSGDDVGIESIPAKIPPQTQKHESTKTRVSGGGKRLDNGRAGHLEATGLSQSSNILQLNIDELLSNSPVKSGKLLTAIEFALKQLKTAIEQIPRREPLPWKEAERGLAKNERVVVPFPTHKPSLNENFKLQYEKPSSINVVGSLPLKLLTRSKVNLCVDLCLTIPSTIFQDKDYLDHRYFSRRAYYIACIAAELRRSKAPFSYQFDYLNGNWLQPILLATPQISEETGKMQHFTIRIIPAIPEATFTADRVHPNKNNIRGATEDGSESSQDQQAAIFYNSTMRSDSLVVTYLKLIHSASITSEAFQGASILGRLWLKRRGFSSHVSQGGFGNFEWAALLALLLSSKDQNRYISPGYSSFQMFKATLQFLASKDLVAMPFICGTGATEKLESRGLPMFFDQPRSMNILYKMSPWSYKLLRHEAQACLSMVGIGTNDSFGGTFIKDLTHGVLQYDALIRIPFEALDGSHGKNMKIKPLIANCQRLYEVLTKALGNRIKLLNVEVPKFETWALNASEPGFKSTGHFSIGCIIDPVHVNRLMDHGPSKDDKTAAKLFRQFWGDKAELRQFNDLRVLESVRWDDKHKTHSVFEQVVSYMLKRRFALSFDQGLEIYADFLSRRSAGRPIAFPDHSLQYQPIINCFTQLERDLRALEGLPLQIRRVIAADPLIGYCSIEQSSVSTLAPLVRPADVVVQFEGSAKWPDELIAIQRTKMAFLIKLSDLFAEAHQHANTRVGLENQDELFLNQTFLDVTYAAQGFTFRVRVQHDREIALLEQAVKLPGKRNLDRAEQAAALATYQRDFLRKPAHVQAMQILCTRYKALAPAVRLAKTWFSSQLLLDDAHICEELVELLVVRTFTTPWPWTTPGSATVAFARTLQYIAEWDWEQEPLIVDLGIGASAGQLSPTPERTGLKATDIDAIKTKFQAWRRVDPALNKLAIFAASSIDQSGTTWTSNQRPARVVAARLTSLTRAASALLANNMLGSNLATLFNPNTPDFDFILKLDDSLIFKGRSKHRSQLMGFKNLETQAVQKEEIEMLGFSPLTMFVDELRAGYGDAVVFFHSKHEQSAIYCVWTPTLGQKEWKAKYRVSSKVVGRSSDSSDRGEGFARGMVGKVEVNRRAILCDIARFADSSIREIEVIKPLD